MNVSEAQLYYFSPTHTSKRVGEAVAAGLQAARLVENDLTHTPADDTILPSSSVAVVAVPVYRGSVAPLALERLQGLHGDGTPVVLLAVYGNRDYEHALDDLDRFMTERGFVTVAAGTFVGEHSYSTPQTPVAAGRPVRSIPRLQKSSPPAVHGPSSRMYCCELQVIDCQSMAINEA